MFGSKEKGKYDTAGIVVPLPDRKPVDQVVYSSKAIAVVSGVEDARAGRIAAIVTRRAIAYSFTLMNVLPSMQEAIDIMHYGVDLASKTMNLIADVTAGEVSEELLTVSMSTLEGGTYDIITPDVLELIQHAVEKGINLSQMKAMLAMGIVVAERKGRQVVSGTIGTNRNGVIRSDGVIDWIYGYDLVKDPSKTIGVISARDNTINPILVDPYATDIGIVGLNNFGFLIPFEQGQLDMVTQTVINKAVQGQKRLSAEEVVTGFIDLAGQYGSPENNPRGMNSDRAVAVLLFPHKFQRR